MIRPSQILAALFYAGAAAFATPALALDAAALREGLAGDMRKLAIHDVPKPAWAGAFTSAEGGTMTVADLAGRVVLLNFWATWCAPCREEMPALNALQHDLGGDDFAVVTVATGRNSPTAMRKFFAEHGIDALPLHSDPRGLLGREAGVLGLPVSVILDRQGREIARLTGGADWTAPEAKALLNAVIAGTRD